MDPPGAVAAASPAHASTAGAASHASHSVLPSSPGRGGLPGPRRHRPGRHAAARAEPPGAPHPALVWRRPRVPALPRRRRQVSPPGASPPAAAAWAAVLLGAGSRCGLPPAVAAPLSALRTLPTLPPCPLLPSPLQLLAALHRRPHPQVGRGGGAAQRGGPLPRAVWRYPGLGARRGCAGFRGPAAAPLRCWRAQRPVASLPTPRTHSPCACLHAPSLPRPAELDATPYAAPAAASTSNIVPATSGSAASRLWQRYREEGMRPQA